MSEVFLVCFALGSLWTLLSFLLGGAHFGHFHFPHLHHGHAHVGHFGHAHGAGHSHGGGVPGWLASLLTPGALAIFLAWFGGAGYVLNRHTGLARWLDIVIAVFMGMLAAFLVAAFLRWLDSHDMPLEASDTGMIGVLGQLSAPIRTNGMGEMIFVREDSRRALPARSEDGKEIQRGEEVIITRYENGVAYVRTWAAFTQPEADSNTSGNSAKGDLI